MSATDDVVDEALREVRDPCGQALGTDWSVHDLGLLVASRWEGDRLVIEITLTDPLCPFFDALEERIRAAVLPRTGASEVEVHLSERVAWHPERLRRPLWSDASA